MHLQGSRLQYVSCRHIAPDTIKAATSPARPPPCRRSSVLGQCEARLPTPLDALFKLPDVPLRYSLLLSVTLQKRLHCLQSGHLKLSQKSHATRCHNGSYWHMVLEGVVPRLKVFAGVSQYT